MATVRLDQRRVDKLKPRRSAYDIRDRKLRGFGVRVLPWFRKRPLGDITTPDVRRWSASLHETPVTADRSAPVLSVITRQAEVYGYRPEGTNPCTGIKRCRRQGRERFPSVAEIRRPGDALARWGVVGTGVTVRMPAASRPRRWPSARIGLRPPAAANLSSLAIRHAGIHWRRPIEWTAAMGQLAILFEDRFPASAR